VSALILAVDTTGDSGSIALVSESGVIEEVALASAEGFAPLSFGEVLFGEIDALLVRAGVRVQDIAAFASASGPGSFTGVRIGLTAVKGLAEATGRPVVAVSNLQALASFGSGPLRAVVIDARRGEIYGVVYDAALEAVREEVVMKLGAWLASLPEGDLEFVTPVHPAGGGAIANALVGRRVIEAPRALAGAIGKIALPRWRRGLAQDPAEIDANYVRRSDAELLWKDPAAGKGPAVR
jgi:tRNA threonylcarbamoyladenosine biosynthesis protein TsaB